MSQATWLRLDNSGSDATQRPSSVLSIGSSHSSHSAANPLSRLTIDVSIGRCRRKMQRKLMDSSIALVTPCRSRISAFHS
jgi:hypothetical protein